MCLFSFTLLNIRKLFLKTNCRHTRISIPLSCPFVIGCILLAYIVSDLSVKYGKLVPPLLVW